jgi:hypothetical protein
LYSERLFWRASLVSRDALSLLVIGLLVVVAAIALTLAFRL